MSYLSSTENIGFSGIPQNISDASCATQYKMAVEGVSGNCSEVMYIPDNSADESTYITHLNDNFYTKFKIDPNELYTFHDSDVIAGEITVSHTEDTFVFPDSVDAKTKLLDSPNKELDILGAFTNGDVKQEIKKKVLSNGHYTPISKSIQKESKNSNTKAQKAKNQVKEARRESLSDVWKQNAQSPKAQIVTVSPPNSKSSIISINTNNAKVAALNKQAGNETFLDVFKREQGLVENDVVVKSEPQSLPPPVKIPTSPPKKSSAKTPLQSKARRGRGPAVHEALQRISAQKRAIPIPNRKWHAPGDNLFDCGPLDNKISAFRVLESSSSDDDNMPDFESGSGPVCVEESAAESRGARLALRRAALRRRVARERGALRLAKHFRDQRTLASIIMKQLNNPVASGHLPIQTVNHLLAMRGMPALLNPQERRKLREGGWSGGCSARDAAAARAAPCARRRLYAACAAALAPLPPLCAEHAAKRDNYDKLLKDNKPKKMPRARAGPPPPPRGAPPPPLPRRAARRRRPPPRARAPPPADHSLSEINVCSNSSAYDSSEETAMGALSENEYITVSSHELEVEGQVPADDMLDPGVLSHIPDEAFTEFFNQGRYLAEGEASFGEGSELAAVLEAVLDERGLDERSLDGRGLDERSLDGRGLDERSLDGRGLDERSLDGRGLDERSLDGRGLDERSLDGRGLDERSLDGRGLDERSLDEQALEDHELEESSLETMDHSMFNHSPDASAIKGKMQVSSSVPMELSSSVSS